jgi:hypothetical protein
MKIFIIPIFLVFLTFTLSMRKNKCIEQWKTLADPRYCCPYPFYADKNASRECKQFCDAQNITGDPFCCSCDCFHRKMMVLVDDEVSRDGIVTMLLGKSKESVAVWKGVMEESYDECLKEMDEIGEEF